MNSPLISAEQLHEKLNSSNLIVLDCSPKANKAGLASDFTDMVIKGARSFNLEEHFTDLSSKFPNMLPSSEQFEKKCRSLGINNAHEIVVYDNLGVYTSPRVWWMFRVMGHDKVSVLNGGLPEWMKKKFPVQKAFDSNSDSGNFQANFRRELVSDFESVRKNIKTKEALVIDLRSYNRFNGIDPEPRKGLRSGNIPHSINIPFQEFLTNGKFRSRKELREVFHHLKDDQRDLIFSCGSGVTACIGYLAGELVLNNQKSVYDGSWTEWACLTPG